MRTDFFGVPDFLVLLRFWDESRGGRKLPEWHGELGRVPADLLPNLVVADARGGEPVYQYVGPEIVRRWGADPHAKPVYQVLRGGHARYIRSLGEDVVGRAAPIFSAAIYRLADEALLMTGRLFVPFAEPGGERPGFVMAVQLFRGPDIPLAGLGDAVFADEIDRRLIVAAPALCARLEEARRYHLLARRVPQDQLAREMGAAAHELEGEAFVALPCLRDSAP
jgi:hypothetical protein